MPEVVAQKNDEANPREATCLFRLTQVDLPLFRPPKDETFKSLL